MSSTSHAYRRCIIYCCASLARASTATIIVEFYLGVCDPASLERVHRTETATSPQTRNSPVKRAPRASAGGQRSEAGVDLTAKMPYFQKQYEVVRRETRARDREQSQSAEARAPHRAHTRAHTVRSLADTHRAPAGLAWRKLTNAWERRRGPRARGAIPGQRDVNDKAERSDPFLGDHVTN